MVMASTLFSDSSSEAEASAAKVQLLTNLPQCKSMTTAWGCPSADRFHQHVFHRGLSWVYSAVTAFMCRSFGILIKLGGNFIFIIINSTAALGLLRDPCPSGFYQIKLISGAGWPRASLFY